MSGPSEHRWRDVEAFDQRARSYENGWRGRLHAEITRRSAALAGQVAPAPRRVLDIGCGTGQLLRTLATRYPKADELCGLDPAPTMVAVAEAAADDPRLNFVTGVAEHLPYPDRHFDLVLATTSFDHWSDQRAGLAECARVAAPSGRLVLVDQFSILLGPTLVGDRRQKARLRGRVDRLLSAAGFASWRWHGLYTPLIRAVVAVAS